jgi:hypothetical protein
MRFALVAGLRREAQPGLSGECPGCGATVIPQCGERRTRHWAHRITDYCNFHWEPETPWHRDWKSGFPTEWQEVEHRAENGERHVADVKTSKGQVIEFQHSYLDPQERRCREAFYGSMIWVVDGLRRKRDMASFYRALQTRHLTNSAPLTYEVSSGECMLLRDWSDSRVAVYFDFGSTEEDLRWFGRPVLWRLSPNSANGWARLSPVPVDSFVEALRQGVPVKGIRMRAENRRVRASARLPCRQPVRQQRSPQSFEQYIARKHRARSRRTM